MKSKKQKTFFVVTALQSDSAPLNKLKRHDTEVEATDHAKWVIERRELEGNTYMDFYVMKAVAKVGRVTHPVKVEKFR